MDQLRRENVFNLPNFLTVLRMAMLPGIVWRFRAGDLRGALTIYLFAMLTDAADGVIARRFHQITTLGKLLDPIADKLCLVVLLGLFTADGQIPGWVLGFVLVKEMLLILGGIAALREGIVVYALPVGKVTTATFILSMIARFLRQRRLADGLLMASISLSAAALIWYSAVLMKKIRRKTP